MVDFSTIELELYTYDYNSSVAYRDVNGVSYTPLKRTEARLKTTSTSTLSLANSNRLEKVMNALVVGAETIIADSLTLETGVTLATGTTIKLSKTGNKAYLRVNIVGDNAANYLTNGGVKIATLPLGFAPKDYTVITVACIPLSQAFIIIDTNGNVRLQSLTTGFANNSTVYISTNYITA